MLAAEYAVGTLPFAERVQFEKRLADDAALQMRVAWWDGHLASLTDDIEPVNVPNSVLKNIEKRLFASAQTKASWFDSLAFWRSLAAASLIGFIAVSGIWYMSETRTGANVETLVAQLGTDDSRVKLTAFYDGTTDRLKLKRTAGEAPADRDFELWVIAGDQNPVSLGVLPRTNFAEIEIVGNLRTILADGALLAISDEPSGGSPTGQPTGDVLAIGTMTKI